MKKYSVDEAIKTADKLVAQAERMKRKWSCSNRDLGIALLLLEAASCIHVLVRALLVLMRKGVREDDRGDG